MRQVWIILAAGALAAVFGALMVGSNGDAVASLEPPAPTPSLDVRHDTPSGRAVPRFVSLRFNDVVGRAGPSFDHPILWRYRREGLPMQVIAETEFWRRVRDPSGEAVWVHRRVLQERRMAMVTGVAGRSVALRDAAADDAEVLAFVEPGVVFALDRCQGGWCRLDGAAASGWAPAVAIWGVMPEDTR